MADLQHRTSWSTPMEACGLFLRGATASAACRVAVVVGVVLSLVNQGGVLLAGEATWATWMRVGINFLVPYVVASVGFLAACREAVTTGDEQPRRRP